MLFLCHVTSFISPYKASHTSSWPLLLFSGEISKLVERREVMAHQDGWPLGLGALNLRAGVIRSVDLSGSFSLSTIFTASQSGSSTASSDRDTEWVPSLPHSRSMTLAGLIGIADVLDLPAGFAAPGRRHRSSKGIKRNKLKALFSLCLRTEVGTTNAVPSLGQFLDMERRQRRVRLSRGSAQLSI